MHEVEHHEMHLEATYPSGAEEWFCPACGRRFVMQWPPAYSMTVIDPGDEHTRHSGSKGGLQLGSSQVVEPEETASKGETDSPQIMGTHKAEDTEQTPLTDELRPWLKWLKDAGLHDDGHEPA